VDGEFLLFDYDGDGGEETVAAIRKKSLVILY
jgi:hypothetical protein